MGRLVALCGWTLIAAKRVKHYSETMRKEIGAIAHSCGVSEPRQLRRNHCRIMQNDGRSVPLSDLYPVVPPAAGELCQGPSA